MSPLLSRSVDRLVASDPGLSRLRMGLAGAVCVSAVLAVELIVGTARHLDPASLLISMLLGSVVAMIGSNALARPSARHSIRAAIFFPVAIGAGLGIGTLVGHLPWVSRLTFVAVMFAAVFIRRFGLDFFFYGFLLWMGFFFSLFLRPAPAQIPQLLFAVTLGTAVVLVLCVSIFRPHPQRTLARILTSMQARRNGMLRTLASRLRAESDKEREKWTRRVFDQRTQFNEMALMCDGWAANSRALPVGWNAESLRKRLLDAQLGLDSLGWAALTLIEGPPRVRETAARLLDLAADGDRDQARRASTLLLRMTAPRGRRESGDARSAPEDSSAISGMSAPTSGNSSGRAGTSSRASNNSSGSAGTPSNSSGVSSATRDSAVRLVEDVAEVLRRAEGLDVPDSLEPNTEFTPAAALTGLGMLPGPASVAKDVTARGMRWNPVVRSAITTRQAVQVSIAGTLAILAGTLVSGQRYYWAVIAAFVVFSGTGSRMDSFRKSTNRVLGTLFGLGVGIVLANLTANHTALSLALIVVCVFLGFYLIRVSYAYMMFFVTILLAQLYGILGQFSDAVLVLRLAETAVGAVIGMLVALLITPVSTRDTVQNALRETTDAIAELLDALAELQRDPASSRRAEIDGLLFGVGNAQRRLALAAAPLTRYSLSENRPRRIRRLLTVAAHCVSAARTTTSRIALLAGEHPRVAFASEEVASLARRVIGDPAPVAEAETAPIPVMVPDPDQLEHSERDALVALGTLARTLRELRGLTAA